MRRAREAGARIVGGHDFLDPWGNQWQVVDYRDVQFTKTDRVLEGMGLGSLEKSERASASCGQRAWPTDARAVPAGVRSERKTRPLKAAL